MIASCDVTWSDLFPLQVGAAVGPRSDQIRTAGGGGYFCEPPSHTSNSQVSPSGTTEQRDASAGGGE